MSILTVLYLSVAFVSIFFDSLRFFLFIPISITLGIGFVAFFRKSLPIRNIITFFVYASFLGLFLNTSVIFLFGSLGVKLDNSFYFLYIICASIINLYLFIKNISEAEVSEYFRILDLDLLDFLWSAIFFIFIFVLINIGLEHYFPNWDSFTYWAIDAKYIFQNSSFRDENFNIIAHSYLPFYPLQLNFVYLLYGEVVEQYSSLLTLYYGLLGGTLLYSFVIGSGKSFVKKSLLFLSIFIAIYSFLIIQGVLFSQYADVFLSVVVLFYFTILFRNNIEIESYWSRFLILLLLSVSLYLTKSNYSVITVVLLFFILIYDFKFLRDNFNRLSKNIALILSLLVIAVYSYFIYQYGQNFSTGDNIVSFTVSGISWDIEPRFIFIFNLFAFVLGHIPIFSVSIVVFILLWIFLKEKYREDVLKILLVFSIAIIPIVYYVITLGNLLDMSLLRYIGLIFFAIPYLFSLILPEIQTIDKVKKYSIVVLIICLSLLLLLKIKIEFGVDLNFSVHSGQYKNFIWQRDFYMIGERVKEVVPTGSEIMIMDQDEGVIGNTSMPVIILRYYLSDYSAGFQYRYPKELFYEYVESISPDYILIYTYDNYFEHCNSLLKDQGTYLILFDGATEIKNTNECFFNNEDIIDF